MERKGIGEEARGSEVRKRLGGRAYRGKGNGIDQSEGKGGLRRGNGKGGGGLDLHCVSGLC